MTDEEKKLPECKCTELGHFFTQVATIFLGVLLAILVSAAILKPQCPCHKGMPPIPKRAEIERQMPPMPHQWQVKQFKKQSIGNHSRFNKRDFKPDKKEINNTNIPQENFVEAD